ncbi:alpha/beta fold hydrolase [Streptomyces sp. IBSBF 2953]|nr:alpha/beta fold hydrolase [Streptomyces hayashii]
MVFDDTGITVNPDGAALTVILFHHAGGSALSLIPLVSGLPKKIRARIAELPGRGIRSKESPATTFDQALHDCVEHTRAYSRGRHIVFGHSLGGVLAHEVALRHEMSGGNPPQRVILSACSLAPGPRTAPVRRGRNELLEVMRRHGGTPAEVFATPHLLDAALVTLGDDMMLVDSYRPCPAARGRNVPYSIWYGAYDETVVPHTAQSWTERVGASSAEITAFPGGHFYLTQSPDGGRFLRDVARAEAATQPKKHEDVQ